MAWVVLFYTFWLALRATAPAILLGTQIVYPSPLIGELALGFLALVASLLALGTYQKVALDGPAAAPQTQTNILGIVQPPAADSVPLPRE